jgi:hypothetical protein
MNKNLIHDPLRMAAEAALEDRFARRVTATLSAGLDTGVVPDVAERLRFARDQALSHARAARKATVAVAASTDTIGLDRTVALRGPGGGLPWWLRLSVLAPLAVLLVGLFWIDHRYTENQIHVAAEVDAAILADELPPDAYRDPGFVEYLRSARP